MTSLRKEHMKTLIIDVETSTKHKGNPFTQDNKLVCIGFKTASEPFSSLILYHDEPSWLLEAQRLLNEAELLVGFNIKFDLHWLKRYGLDFSHCRVWDCQVAEFLLEAQTTPYPSLNKTAEKYKLGQKVDVVKTEYWDKGIDTIDIPREILSEYLFGDLDLTERVYHQQQPLIKDTGLSRIFSLQCQDLLVLEEMEFNGLMFDTDKAAELAEQEKQKISDLEVILKEGYEEVPINWNSRDHLSCYLYGGTITHEDRICVGVYKTGAKEGQPRYKKLQHHFALPKLVEPPKGSELLKEGYYATDDGTLRNIKTTKSVSKRIATILERAQSNKLLGTYYEGLPGLIKEMGWPDGKIHGNFNQCVAATGRLSSSKPNLQNLASEVDVLITSRYC